MQILIPDPRADYRSVPDALNQIIRHEGPRKTFCGITAVVAGSGPAHALYFSCYEYVKKKFSTDSGSNHLVHGVFTEG